jgi:hypothetical protein
MNGEGYYSAVLGLESSVMTVSGFSPNPAFNGTQRNEAVACNIVYSDTPAINHGSTTAVLFVGLDTHVTDVYGIKLISNLSII